MRDYEKEIAVEDERIAKRKRALGKKRQESGEKAEEMTGAKTGLLGERELRRLLKQAQRRKRKLVKDRDRRAKTEKQPQMSADEPG